VSLRVLAAQESEGEGMIEVVLGGTAYFLGFFGFCFGMDLARRTEKGRDAALAYVLLSLGTAAAVLVFPLYARIVLIGLSLFFVICAAGQPKSAGGSMKR